MLEAIAPPTLCCEDEIPMAVALATVRTIAGAEKCASGWRDGETAGTECPPEQSRKTLIYTDYLKAIEKKIERRLL